MLQQAHVIFRVVPMILLLNFFSDAPTPGQEPYIRTMPHSEYPSASSCICEVRKKTNLPHGFGFRGACTAWFSGKHQVPPIPIDFFLRRFPWCDAVVRNLLGRGKQGNEQSTRRMYRFCVVQFSPKSYGGKCVDAAFMLRRRVPFAVVT